MADLEIDGDLVRELALLLEETGLIEIEYAVDGRRIRVTRPGPARIEAPIATAPAPIATATPAKTAGDEPPAGAVTAPMVGTVFTTPEPDAAPFVQVGDIVEEGRVLFLIEAMKTFNPVRAHRPGTVKEILVESGMPVEYGEPLMILE